MRAHLACSCAVVALLAVACATPSGRTETELPRNQMTSEEWRRERPAPGEPVPLHAPTFKRGSLPNGLTVIVSERHDLPVVSVDLALKAGTSADPEGKEGLAQLTYLLLLEGAGSRDAAALDLAFADIGTSPSVSAGVDGGLVGVEVLRENLDPAMALLADVVLRPRFDAASFEHRKEQSLSSLAYQAGNPNFLAGEAMAEAVFGPHHPYGRLGSGTPRSVSTLSLKDAKGFWARAAGPKEAALVFAGDVTLDDAMALAGKWFGGWKAKAAPFPAPPAPKVQERAQIVFVPKPGLGQTIIRVGRPGIAAGSPDQHALELANSVFGGMFGSRLNMNLREDKGYTYGARSSVDARRGVGPLVASSAVRADATGPALAEVFAELQGMRARPITQEELEGAREGKIRSIPGWFETVGALASAGANLFWLDLSLDHYDRVIQGLESASAEEVQRAAEAYLDPSLMQIVLVGDPEIVRSQVPSLGLGEIVERKAVPLAPGK